MVGYADIARFGLNEPQSVVGAMMTPNVMGGVGASNPTASYLQTIAAPANAVSSYGASGLGSVGFDPLNGYHTNANSFPTAPGTNAASGALGFNVPTFQLALGGLQTIGSLWNAWNANKLAKQQFAFQKDFATNNLVNQIQSYNTTLEDRARSRYHTEGGTQEDAQAYIDKNRLHKTF